MRAICGTTRNHVMTCMTASRIRDDHVTPAGCTSGPHSETTAKPVKTHMTIAPA